MDNLNRRASSSEGCFLELFFIELKKLSMEYCVLRNFQSLPTSLEGSDLDLLVLPSQRDAIAGLVKKVAARCGGRVIADYATTGRFIKLLGCHEGKWWGCAVDLLAGIDYRGMTYVSSDSMLERVESYRGINVASESDVEVMALVKEVVNNGKTRKSYFHDACTAYEHHGDSCLQILEETFSKNLIDSIRSMLRATLECEDEIKKTAKAMRREIWKSCVVSQFGSVVKNVMMRVSRLLNPPGFCVAITGTDGAGKTTIVDTITPILERSIHNELKYNHLRPNWIKGIGVAMGKRTEIAGAVVNPHSQKPSGFCGSLFRLGYYMIDYVIGYWIKIYPMLVKRVNICLFDRYYYDIAIDPRRMRMALPKSIMNVVFWFIPQPSLVLCLGGDPEHIYARKPETSLEEVTRQVKALKKLCASNKRAVWVDTGCLLEESKSKALSAVMDAMSARDSSL